MPSPLRAFTVYAYAVLAERLASLYEVAVIQPEFVPLVVLVTKYAVLPGFEPALQAMVMAVEESAVADAEAGASASVYPVTAVVVAVDVATSETPTVNEYSVFGVSGAKTQDVFDVLPDDVAELPSKKRYGSFWRPLPPSLAPETVTVSEVVVVALSVAVPAVGAVASSLKAMLPLFAVAKLEVAKLVSSARTRQ